MDWEIFQPKLMVEEPEYLSCPESVNYSVLTHAISFALGSAATVYYMRWYRGTTVDRKTNSSVSNAQAACPAHVGGSCDAAVESSEQEDSAPDSGPLCPVPSDSSLQSQQTAELRGGSDHVATSSLSLAQSSGTGELEVALHEATLAGILRRAEYTGSRSAACSAQLLLQIALDAPARWSAADYEFVTHCKTLVSLADHEDIRLQTAAERIERLQNDIWKYIKLQLKRSEVGIQARDDKRKHSLACSRELQARHPSRVFPCTIPYTFPSTAILLHFHSIPHRPAPCSVRLDHSHRMGQCKCKCKEFTSHIRNASVRTCATRCAGGREERISTADARPLHKFSMVFPTAMAASMDPIAAGGTGSPGRRLRHRHLALHPLLNTNPPTIRCANAPVCNVHCTSPYPSPNLRLLLCCSCGIKCKCQHN